MLTGQIPHDAETPFAIIINRLQEPPPSARSLNPSLPEAADQVVLKALARQPENRYGSTQELASAFREAIDRQQPQVVVEAPFSAAKKEPDVFSPGSVTPSLSRPKPPVSPDPGQLEQQYRERLKARYGEEAAYYVPLTGETSEVVSKRETPAPRSTRRRRRRAQAAYHEWIQSGQEIKRVKLETLVEAVDKYPCIILLGDPGSGKTTALENLAYQFADEPDRLPQ
jgi:HrpA-like RNA helicase